MNYLGIIVAQNFIMIFVDKRSERRPRDGGNDGRATLSENNRFFQKDTPES